MPVSAAPGGTFRKKIPVRFADVDYARILYFPRYFHFVHLVMEDFFREVLDLPYSVVLRDHKVGFPTVHTEATFSSPLEFGDEAEVAMRVREIGRSRVVFEYDVSNKGRPAGRCVQTTVAVSLETWKPIELPAAYRGALESVRKLATGG